MKTNLNNFPTHDPTFTDGEEHSWAEEVLKWKIAFEEEVKSEIALLHHPIICWCDSCKDKNKGRLETLNSILGEKGSKKP